ncbi:nuclear transport factor 2 family protein [candidate division KSB1 bacterium]|nr:nuclear transport factor 2 family protein [candidate division KSB1 bacterium]
MRYSIFVAVLCFLMASCQSSQDNVVEKEAVDGVRLAFFEAITKYDYQALRNQCTEDFVLFENGLHWNADSLINIIKSFEAKQASFKYSFEDIKTEVQGALAWTTYRNHGLISMAERQIEYEWLESAIFKKRNGLWKIAFLHSTVVRRN